MSSARIQKNLVPKIEKINISSNKSVTYHFNYYKNLYECACSSGEFDRTKKPRRTDSEKKMDEIIAKSFPKKYFSKLTYLSLGAGGLLQDYLYCENLIRNNYSLDIFLIEHNHQTKNFTEALKQFRDLQHLAINHHVEISIHTYDSILSFIKFNPTTEVDIAIAIDFSLPQTYFQDIALVHQALKYNGFFYLALMEQDILLKKTSCEFKKSLHWWQALFSANTILADICELPYNNDANRAEIILKSVTKFGKTEETINQKHILKIILQYMGIFHKSIQPESSHNFSCQLNYHI